MRVAGAWHSGRAVRECDGQTRPEVGARSIGCGPNRLRKARESMLNSQLPWFVGGPVLGLCVVAVRLLLGERLGVSRGYTELVERARARSTAFDWPAFFLSGVIVGGAVFALAAGGPDFHGYG